MYTPAKSAVVAGLVVLLSACGQSGTGIMPSTAGQSQALAQRAPNAAAQRAPSSDSMQGGVEAGHVYMPLAGRQQTTGDLTGSVSWGGGPVQQTPIIYVIYWGLTAKNCAVTPGKTQACDPDNIRPTQESFFQNVGGSAWQSTITQYYDSHGDIASPTQQFVTAGKAGKECNGAPSHCILDSSLPPMSPTDHQVQVEAEKLVDRFGANPNAAYIVQTPYGRNESGFGTSWCAYHSAFSDNGVYIAYAYMPYMPEAPSSCGGNYVNPGAAGLLDGVTIVGGHELAEPQTAPNPDSGWNGSGGEIADLCAWKNLSNEHFGNNTTFPVQPLWSDVAGACTLTGPHGP